MTEHDFDVMLKFKAQAGIVPLVQWVKQLRDEYEQEINELKNKYTKGKEDERAINNS